MLIRLLLMLLPTPLYAGTLLIVSSYHPQYLWDISYNQGLQSHLAGHPDVHYFYLDTKRLPREAFDSRANEALRVYNRLKPDWVLLSDDNAINYLAHPIADAGTPVVFLGMNENPRYKGLIGHRNVTGVLERPLLKRNIQEMARMMGGLERALVLFDSSNVSLAAIEDEFDAQTELRIGRTRITSELYEDYNLWQEAVLKAKQNGYRALFIGLYHTLKNSAGEHVDENEVLAWTVRNSPVPVFCFWEFAVGQGQAIGGLVLDGHEQGVRAAELLNAIMAGARPESMAPRAAERGKYSFSRSELARWHLQPLPQWQEKIEWRP